MGVFAFNEDKSKFDLGAALGAMVREQLYTNVDNKVSVSISSSGTYDSEALTGLDIDTSDWQAGDVLVLELCLDTDGGFGRNVLATSYAVLGEEDYETGFTLRAGTIYADEATHSKWVSLTAIYRCQESAHKLTFAYGKVTSSSSSTQDTGIYAELYRIPMGALSNE